jgi:Fe-S cluster assembly protein SufD
MNMHATPQRTAAETALIDAFGEHVAEFPGDGEVMIARQCDRADQGRPPDPARRELALHRPAPPADRSAGA